MRGLGRAVRRLRLLPALIVVLTASASLTGCATPARSRISAEGLEGAALVRSELLFGRAKPNGSTVSEAEWQAFVDSQVTPRFPDGLTILEASGQYRTRAGQLVREGSKIVIVVHPADERSRAAIQEIRALYKQLFDQESVLLISTGARVSF